jgi:hypothetical protein
LKGIEDPEVTVRRLQKKVSKIEKRNRELMKERDYLDRVAKISQRIIKRQGWDSGADVESKKNGISRSKLVNSIEKNGQRINFLKPESLTLPLPGESIVRLPGDGENEDKS